jgi:(R)-1-hydroxy-2-aminoethylphosphonate ammonia-lyase
MSKLDYKLQQSEGDSNNSPLRSDWQSEHVKQESRELLNRDSDVYMHQSLSTPCLNQLIGSEGPYLIDSNERRILDFHGNSVHQVGFGHPKVIDAVHQQMQTLPFCTRRYTNETAVAFAEKLVSICPDPLNKVLLCPAGTGAIGMAMKLARLVTGHYKTISMWHSFHGASLDAISIGGERLFRDSMGPLLPGCRHVDPIGRDGSHEQSLEQITKLLENEGNIGAIIAEPIRWSTVTVPAPEYWQAVRKLCDKHGVLLVFDEIGSGLGRTGRWFAFEHFGIVPDILVLGKGLGGGIMPLAGMVVRDGLDLAGDRSLGHYTHEKNPVSCAAGLATLNVIEENSLVSLAQEKGQYLQQRLLELKQDFPQIKTVRGFGLLIGVEVENADLAESIMYACLSRGLNFKISDGDVLTLVPPLTITNEQLDDAVNIMRGSFAAVTV